MSNAYSVGSKVSWSWGQGEAKGKITDVFKKRVQRTIKGSKITRNASDKNPAYMVEQSDGSRALKSHSELEKA